MTRGMSDEMALAVIRTAFPSATIIRELPENTMPQNTHVCPVADCTLQVDNGLLMCPAHWRQVPGAIQNAVWAAWRNGAGEGSLAHHSAITAAVRAVGRR
jgi:hypothetical protein